MMKHCDTCGDAFATDGWYPVALDGQRERVLAFCCQACRHRYLDD